MNIFAGLLLLSFFGVSRTQDDSLAGSFLSGEFIHSILFSPLDIFLRILNVEHKVYGVSLSFKLRNVLRLGLSTFENGECCRLLCDFKGYFQNFISNKNFSIICEYFNVFELLVFFY